MQTTRLKAGFAINFGTEEIGAIRETQRDTETLIAFFKEKRPRCPPIKIAHQITRASFLCPWKSEPLVFKNRESLWNSL